MNSQDHVIEGSFDVLGGSYLLYVTILPSLVTIDIIWYWGLFLVVEQQLPYVHLNPLLLFISEAHGMKVHGILCTILVKRF